jgi:protein AaeX
MRIDVNVLGIYFTSFFVYMMLAIPLFVIMRRLLFRVGFYRFVWHPNLFEVALYTVVVNLLVFLVPL